MLVGSEISEVSRGVGGRLDGRAGGVSSEERVGKSKVAVVGAGDLVGSSPHSQEYSVLGMVRGGTSRFLEEEEASAVTLEKRREKEEVSSFERDLELDAT